MGPFGPGSEIRLMAGDTWTNDPLIIPAGSLGHFASGVYVSTYNSTFNTNLAAYQAGATKSDMKTLLINAGESAGTADTDANEYCRLLAVEDAVLAGHAAAQPASEWVVIGKYGSGANPIIDGNNVAQWGIDLSGSDRHYQGGWKIADIDIKNCQVAAIRAESPSAGANGLWVTAATVGGATIDHITGVAFNATTHTLDTPISGYSHFTAIGIDTTQTNYVFLENYNITNTDTPWFSVTCADSVSLNLTATHSYYLHPYVGEFLPRVVCKDCTMDDMCNIGLASGRAGVFVAVGTDYILDGLTVKNGTLSGNCIDMEGQMNKLLIRRCTLRDYNGAAILDNSNGGQNVGTWIVDCTINHCANVGVDTIANVIQTNPNVLGTDHLIMARNTIIKDPDQGFLFCGPTYSTSKTNTITDRITNAIFGPDNSVS